VKQLRQAGDRLVILILVLAAWQFCSGHFGEHWFSSPMRTATTLWSMAERGLIVWHASYTIQAAFWGLLIGGIPGVLIPFLLRRSPALSEILDPYFVAGYGLPKLALAPLFILWFGIGLGSKIALVASIVFFILLFSTAAGVQAVNAQFVSMARIMGAKESDIARHIVWPGAVPYIFTGIKLSAPYAIGAAVVGELISSNRGLGYLIEASATDFDTAGVFAALAALTILVLVVNALVNWAEQRLLQWRPRDAVESMAAT